MIKRLYFIRHGQSEANAGGVYAGSQPHIRLTEQGEQQAALAAHLMTSWGINQIISSNLDRAQHTARIIAKTLGLNPEKTVIEPLLCEVNVGRLAGTPDLGFPSYLSYAKSGIDPEAETPEVVAIRVRRFLATLERYDGDTVLIVAHAGVGRILRSILTGIPMSELALTNISNCEPIELPLDRLAVEAKR